MSRLIPEKTVNTCMECDLVSQESLSYCKSCYATLRTRVDSLTEINLINEDVIQGQSDKITALREVVEKAFYEGHQLGRESAMNDAGFSSPSGNHVDEDWEQSEVLAKVEGGEDGNNADKT